jgi:DsbC/DsbD-like thiol-disulfide interchange protein
MLPETREDKPRKTMSTLRMAAPAALAIAVAPAFAETPRAEPAKDADAASAWVELHASRARLVAGESGTTAGTRLVGVEIAMADGWKTYWRMPGDAGVPPTFDWSGSSNAANIKVLYPAPTRMAEAGGEVIGYKHAVLFPVEVTPQDPARPVALKLSVELGICREICVPATATFELVLPPAGKTAQSDAVAAAIGWVPRPQAQRRPSDPELRKVAMTDRERGARLTIQAAFGGGRSGDVFVEAPEGLYVPMLRKEGQGADGVVGFGVDLSADLARDLKGKTLTLTLVSETGASEAQWTVP